MLMTHFVIMCFINFVLTAINKKIATSFIRTNDIETHTNNVDDQCKELILNNGNLEDAVQNGKTKNDNNKSIKSWASLFNNKNVKDTYDTDKNDNINLSADTNGSLDMKPLPYYANNAKYDDPNYYRMGGMSSVNII